MQIEIDFEVFKALTAMRQSEKDSYSSVIRRLLDPRESQIQRPRVLINKNEPLDESLSGRRSTEFEIDGVWFNGIHLPNGTNLRATYKGMTYTAKIEAGKWIDQTGVARTSPSDAARAVCDGTSVNGWRFWYVRRPDDNEWQRLDQLR